MLFQLQNAQLQNDPSPRFRLRQYVVFAVFVLLKDLHDDDLVLLLHSVIIEAYLGFVRMAHCPNFNMNVVAKLLRAGGSLLLVKLKFGLYVHNLCR